MRGWIAVLGLTLGLVACQQPGGAEEQAADAAASADMAMMEVAAPEPGRDAPAIQAPATAPMLAYAYSYTLELPTDQVGTLMSRHEQACVRAGAALCQVVGSGSTSLGRDDASGRLELRAAPAWIARFRSQLAGDAEQAGGRVREALTESEDLTRAIVDTEAALRAKTTLRDRLQQLLATRSGSLDQLLALERELARVQGEIDATRSNLAVMRTRVATSRLTIDYQSAGVLAPDSAFTPVSRALDGALTVFMSTVGALITVLAVVAPLALIAGPLAWWGLRRRRRRADRASTPGAADPQ